MNPVVSLAMATVGKRGLGGRNCPLPIPERIRQAGGLALLLRCRENTGSPARWAGAVRRR